MRRDVEPSAVRDLLDDPPRATLAFMDSTESGRAGCSLRGSATCHRGLPAWRVLVRIAVKYYVSPRALRVELRNLRRSHLRWRYYA